VVKGLLMARSEALMMLGLVMAVVIQLNFGKDQTEERLVWAVLLLIQALPYTASVLLSLFSVMPERLRLPGLDQASPPQPAPASNP
jgi:hypothetical protein